MYNINTLYMTDGFRGLPRGNVNVAMPTVWAIQFINADLPFFVIRQVKQESR